MKEVLYIEVKSVDRVNRVTTNWTREKFINLLELLDFEDWDEILPEEMEFYASYALSQFEPEEAARMILNYSFGNRLNDQEIKTLALNMFTYKMWVKYPDVSMHREIFNCGLLLHKAFPTRFPDAVAIQCRLKMVPDILTPREFSTFFTPDLLLSILAKGLVKQVKLDQLYTESIYLDVNSLPHSEFIIWEHQAEIAEDGLQVSFVSSSYWLNPLKNIADFQAEVVLPNDTRAIEYIVQR